MNSVSGLASDPVRRARRAELGRWLLHARVGRPASAGPR
jgi:hypothetical protein